MFCQKCWHEFRNDGSTCFYCGAPKPVDEWELDWEEAARSQEAQENAILQLSGQLSAVSHPAKKHVNDFIHPNDLSNCCASCGKEIPTSARAKICANCSASKERKKTEAKKQNDIKEKEQKREKAAQDNCIRPNDSPLNCIVCGKTLPTSARSDVCAVCASRGARRDETPVIRRAAANVPVCAAGAPAHATAKWQRSKRSGLSIAVVTIVILSIIIGPSLFHVIRDLGANLSGYTEAVSETAVLISEPDSVEIDEYDNTQTLESSSASESYLYFSFSDPQARPPLKEADADAIYTDYVLAATNGMMAYIIPLIFDDVDNYLISIDSSVDQISKMDGVYYLSGEITYYYSADVQEYTEPFVAGWILYDQAEAALCYLEMSGDILFG